MKGYKATDKDLKCKDFQFELGVWYEHSGEMIACQSGFHFCEQPSGPWAYYSDPTTRIFEIEADDVLEVPFAPGADFKRVCRRIRLVKEINLSGYGNTGDRNTGYRNTGYRNTGDRNTGDRNTGYGNTGYGNTGDGNTGDRNTGDVNTGDRNTGDRNTGDWNTGYWNTGDGNTGYWNTGHRNTGDRNTGDGNTGDGNATNFSTGFFCIEEPKVISFDTQTLLNKDEYAKKYPHYLDLCQLLQESAPIEFSRFFDLPGITEEKLKNLHDKIIEKKGQKWAKK